MKGIKKVNTSSYNNRRLITIMLVTREDIDNKEIEYGKENEKENDIRERGKETNENDSQEEKEHKKEEENLRDRQYR